VAYGVILIAFSHRYLPVFPHEAELNPVELLPSDEKQEVEAVEPLVDSEQELKPAEA
jgi:molybdopterin-containing oxidoreductase family membrane subunit